MTGRVQYVDFMKAVGITLVVIGHAPGIPEFPRIIIYSFHMPMFFFVSGFLLSETKLAMRFPSFVRLQLRSLALPFVSYFSIALAFWVAITRNSPNNRFTVLDAIFGGIYASGSRLFVDTPLWFFASLFVVSIAYFSIRSCFGRRVAVIVSITLSATASNLLPLEYGELPWCLDVSCVAIGFYAIGAWFRGHREVLDHIRLIPSIFIGSALMLSVASIASTNVPADMLKMQFGRFHSLYFVNAFAGIFGLMLIGRSVPESNFIQWLSRHTIVIFPLHMLAFVLFSAIGVKVFQMPSGFATTSAWWGFAYTAAAIVLCWPASIVLRRSSPLLFGV